MKKAVKFAKRIVEGEHVRLIYFYDTAVAYFRPSSSNGSRNDLPWLVSLSANDAHTLSSLVLLGDPRK